MRIALALAALAFAPAAAPNVDSLVLRPAQVGTGYVMLARTDGRGVRGTVTMNLCGTNYASEGLRATRLQVNYLKNNGATGLSNEIVAYKAGGAAQAMHEVIAHARTCPAGLLPSGVAGVPPLRYEVTRIAVPGLLKGYLAVRVRTIGNVNGKHIDQISYAVYQRLGEVLSGVYSFGPDTGAQRDFCIAAARQSARNLRKSGIAGEGPSA
jgi:hypothetical protein